MGFDSELARALLEEADRDRTAFFAGRGAEIGRFDAALRTAERRFETNQRALFLVYQGAPGCGKTSLSLSICARRVRKRLGCSSRSSRRIWQASPRSRSVSRRAAEEPAPAGGRMAARFALALASYLRVDGSGAELRNLMADRTAKRSKVVLHLDEAQVVDEGRRGRPADAAHAGPRCAVRLRAHGP